MSLCGNGTILVRSRQVTQPWQGDNEFSVNDNFLSPRANAPIQSEGGRSVLSFASIESVHDRGTSNHAVWEHKVDTSVEVDKHREILGNKPVTVDNLTDALWKTAQDSKIGSKENFLTLDKLKTLINPDSVTELLDSMGYAEDDVKHMIRGIFSNHLSVGYSSVQQEKEPQRRPSLYRVFAILVMTKKVESIRQFIRHGINDSVLPLCMDSTPNRGLHASTRMRSMGSPDMDSRKLNECFSAFKDTDFHLFCIFQKAVSVPFFRFPEHDSAVFFYDLDPGCVLPIIDVGEPKSGGYGSVQRIRFHPAHHNYGGVEKVRTLISYGK